MDCLRAREIVSEAFDRGVANVPEAAEARDHCRTCPECRRFVEGLGMLEKIAPPVAPPYLVEEIVDRARRMAAANVPPIVGRKPAAEPEETAEETGESQPFAVEVPVSLAPVPRPKRWTAGRITAVAAALLIGVFALSASMQGFVALKGGGGVTAVPDGQAALESSDPGYDAAGGAKAASPPSMDRSMAGSASAGTRYVSFEGQAYFWLGPRKPEGDTLVRAGSLTSALEAASDPRQHDVWRSKADADLIFIRGEDEETYVAFRRATRSLDGKAYALYSDELKAYGLWPALPSRYTTPTATDGAPTFTVAGKDDAGLDIYAPPGSDPSAGFAVAPNTTPDDPAAGNPNWTWWVPRP